MFTNLIFFSKDSLDEHPEDALQRGKPIDTSVSLIHRRNTSDVHAVDGRATLAGDAGNSPATVPKRLAPLVATIMTVLAEQDEEDIDAK